jgi:hypothetical protein
MEQVLVGHRFRQPDRRPTFSGDQRGPFARLTIS